MKKALIVLLLLAFVAGGLFAQFSFSGRIDGGLGIFQRSGDDEDFTMGMISKQLDGGGVRAEVNMNVTNEAGNAGLSFRLRANGSPAGTAFRDALQWRWAYAWVKGLDGVIEAQGGRIQGTDYDTLDDLSDGDTLYDAHGLLFYIRPVDVFSFGVGANAGATLGSASAAKDVVTGWFGFGVNMDAFTLVAQMSFARDDVNAYVSASVDAIDNVDIIVTAGLWNLSDFSDFGSLFFYEQFGFSGVENLGLNLGLVQGIAQAADDIYFRGVLWVTYAIGNIIPRLDINFVMGGCYDVGSFYFTGDSFAPTFNKDMLYVSFTPQVKLQAAKNCFVDVGFFGGIDLGDVPAFGGNKTGFNYGAFCDIMVRM